ncbi:MAG TPA: NepR family anti-sigma factor [Methylobacterium sp.]|jgi:hypothetical protein
MAKTQTDRADSAKSAAPGPAPLSPSIRRHLGRGLRVVYADALTEPVGQRIEDLLDRLDKPAR